MVTINERKCSRRRLSGPLTAEERGVYGRIPDHVDYVSHRSFAAGSAEDRLFGSGAEAIDVAIHSREDAVVNIQPALIGAERRSAGAYPGFVPVVLDGFDYKLGAAPVNQIRGETDPDGPGAYVRMRSVEPDEIAVDFLREEDDVSVVGLGDKGEPFDGLEVGSFSEAGTDAAVGICTVCYVVGPFEVSDAGVLDAECFVSVKGRVVTGDHKRPGVGFEIEAIVAPGQADYRPAGIEVRAKEHDIAAVEFGNSGVVNCLDGIRDIVFREDWIAFVAGDKFIFHL